MAIVLDGRAWPEQDLAKVHQLCSLIKLVTGDHHFTALFRRRLHVLPKVDNTVSDDVNPSCIQLQVMASSSRPYKKCCNIAAAPLLAAQQKHDV